MKLLANENFPLKSIIFLRNAGYDIVSITEKSPGIQDEQVLQRAVNEQRIILTFDRDYGELIYKKKLPKPAGIIYFRFVPLAPEEPAEYLFDLFTISDVRWSGKFTTLERGRMRQRPL